MSEHPTPDPAITMQAHHESLDVLQRLAYQLHFVDRLPWQAVADEFEEPKTIVQDLAQAYIERTEAAARDAQGELF